MDERSSQRAAGPLNALLQCSQQSKSTVGLFLMLVRLGPKARSVINDDNASGAPMSKSKRQQ
jgi:hypothetical protein